MKDLLLTKIINIQTAFAQKTEGGTARGDTRSIDLGDLNPFGKDSNLFSIFQLIIGFLYRLAFPVAVIMIMWGAFLILTAGGKPENASKGRAAIMWAVIGLIVVILVNAVFMESCSPDPTSLRYSPNCEGAPNSN